MISEVASMQALYYSIVLLFIYMAVYLLKESHQHKKKVNIKFKNHRFRKMRSEFIRKLNEKDTFFLGSGLSISRYQYGILRTTILAVIFIFQIIDARYASKPIVHYITFGILVMITSPRMTIMNIKTPFARVLQFLQNSYRKKIDLELYNSISQLKNLAVVQKDHPMSADFLIEQLVRSTNKSRKIYMQTLSMMREGKDEEAIEFFKQAINSKLAIEFANIIPKLDYLNPVELKDQLVLIQSSFRNEKTTMKLAQQEILSNLIFLPIV
ncbi:MAG: hypothetical protein MJA31_07975, partial [Clostridia bacterium]|nr:hypothetical protein [Clostridia bacterium]